MAARASTAALAAVVLLLLVGGAVRDAAADHGVQLNYISGPRGEVWWAGNLCQQSMKSLVLYPPYSVTASYSGNNLPPQRVWWTPRVWWKIESTGAIVHNAWAAHGWYWTWAAAGDTYRRYSPFPETDWIGGGSNRVWQAVDGQLLPGQVLSIPVGTGDSKHFAVEYILYWAPNEQQPMWGAWAGLSTLQDDFLQDVTICSFR